MHDFLRDRLFDVDQAGQHTGAKTMQRHLAPIGEFDAVMMQAALETGEDDLFGRRDLERFLEIGREIFKVQLRSIGNAYRGGAIARRREANRTAWKAVVT